MNTLRIKSQEQRLLNYLKSGKTINVFSPAKQRLRIGYLNSRISGLKKQGYDVNSKWISVKDINGESVNVKEYSIKKTA